MVDKVVRVCYLCESSCTDPHTYNIKDRDQFLCEKCYLIIEAALNEMMKKREKAKKVQSTTTKKAKK